MPRARAFTYRAMPNALADALRARTVPAALARADGDAIRCDACAHRCVVTEGRAGACGVRFVEGGVLRAPHGYVARAYVRPIETNTVYHVRPGALALTFGTYGCDLRCPYCHNARVSQALREPSEGEHPIDVTADAIAERAVRDGCAAVCAAYNEPMIAAEWVRDVFAACKARGLVTVVVTDGHSTREAMDLVRPVTDVFRVDLKAHDESQYRALGGRMAPVLESVERARALGFWVEVVTLVVPHFNDAERGVRALAETLARIDPAMPWHLNAFQPRYKMLDRPRTNAALLTSMAGIAYARGMKFVYVGNVHDAMPHLEHTRCPACARVLVERADYRATAVHLERGACPDCGCAIEGLWAVSQ